VTYSISDVDKLIFMLDEELTFIHPDDAALYNEWDSRAFELQVANHELLGHGSGRLFQEDEKGKKNFDPEVISLLFQLETLVIHSIFQRPLTP
jgi:hypothetical protein